LLNLPPCKVFPVNLITADISLGYFNVTPINFNSLASPKEATSTMAHPTDANIAPVECFLLSSNFATNSAILAPGR
jgi:hypothetical protein